MRQVGGTGTGPGEYIMPDHLFIFHGALYYNDMRNTLLKSLPLPESNTTRFRNIPLGRTESFAMSDSLIAVQYDRAPFLRVYSNPADETEKPQLLQETLTPASFHTITNERLAAGNVLIDIYILPVSPLKISVYQYRQSQIKSIREYNLERLPRVLSWTAKKEKKYLRLPQKSRENYFISSFSVPEKMYFLHGISEALFVTLYTRNPEMGHCGYLLSLKDSLLASYKLGNLYPMAVLNDTLYFYSKDSDGEEPVTIESYEYTG